MAKVRSLLAVMPAAKEAESSFEALIKRSVLAAPFLGQHWEQQQMIIRGGVRILERLDARDYPGVRSESDVEFTEAARVFVSHSGESPALGKLLHFISSCGLRPLLAERQAFRGHMVPNQTRLVMDNCSIAVIFAEATLREGSRAVPGPGVLVEVGILQERFGNRVVYLLEHGADFGAMLEPYAYTRFSTDCLDDAFERLVLEFRAHGLLGEGGQP